VSACNTDSSGVRPRLFMLLSCTCGYFLIRLLMAPTLCNLSLFRFLLSPDMNHRNSFETMFSGPRHSLSATPNTLFGTLPAPLYISHTVGLDQKSSKSKRPRLQHQQLSLTGLRSGRGWQIVPSILPRVLLALTPYSELRKRECCAPTFDHCGGRGSRASLDL
jgi:hypothetical protein